MPTAAHPICAPLTHAARIAEHEAFVVPVVVDAAHAGQLARGAILEGLLRPGDIASAEIEPPALAWAPFWRVHTTVDGFHLGLTAARGSDGSIQGILPTGGARHREAVLLVTARRNFPYEPALMQTPGTLAMMSGTPSLRAFDINLEEMVPRASYAITEGEIVAPDVEREAAEREAMDRIRRSVQPASALYAKYEPKVKAAAFCHYPLFVTRYHYEGHAKRHTGEAFYVVVSGRSGEVVGARHPSAMKALARKIRRLITP